MDIPKKLENINITYFIWYLLPGLNIIGINILLPLCLIYPHKVIILLSISNAVAILFAALIIGYIIDSLKLYQFSVGYSKASENFFDRLGSILKVTSSIAKERFEVLKQLEDRKDPLLKAIAVEHSSILIL
jgi:hypothetical protein